MKLASLVVAVMIALVPGCGVSSDKDDSATASAAAAESVQPDESAAQASASDPQLPEAMHVNFTCSQLRGSCVTRSFCSGNDGTQLTASGCANPNVCCGFNPCLNAHPANVCTTAAICAGNGVRQGLPGCPSGRVCCRQS